MALLQRGQQIDRFTVQSIIKENLYTETYRVEDADAQPFFLKVFDMQRLPEKLVNKETGDVLEIGYSRKLTHRNIIHQVASGMFATEQTPCQYYATDYLSGGLLSERIQREGKLAADEATAIISAVLEGLRYMHAQGLCHNDLTPRNIMLPQGADAQAEIIDLGHVATRCDGHALFDTADLDVRYSANETFMGFYDAQSDLFSAAAVLYAMIMGHAPWEMTFDDGLKRTRRIMLLKEKRRQEPIDFSALPCDGRLKTVLARGLALVPNERYESAEQMLADLRATGEPAAPQPERKATGRPQPSADFGQPQPRDEGPNAVEFNIKRGGGNGFKDIAGMQPLKDYLTQHVLFVIKDKERAAKYHIQAPNGLLLYGPPGCGKTFVAEKFAEESGFNFILVKSSDLASSYLHGSQEKIAKLFRLAEKNAPIVLCFDEFDALVPDRSTPAATYSSGEVNEFLSQLNNCSERGIFVVGTTNRPDKIDPAVLRTGRIDKQVFVPLPDREARSEMFRIHLAGRPMAEDGIDANRLADLTDGFIASDIAYTVNEAAIVAAYTDSDITEQLLETAVSNTHPSLRSDTMNLYEGIRQKMESTARRSLERPHVGFV